MDNNVTFQINIAGNVFAGVGKLQGDFQQLVQVVGNVDKSVNQTFTSLKSKVESINLSAIITQVKEVSQAIANLSQPGIVFEQGMADLSSITGTMGEDLIELGKAARKTGKESGLGAAEAARAFTILASQIQVDDIGLDGLKELQQNAITLAHAAGMTMDDAANALAGTINQFGFEANEASRVINVLAAGSKYGAAEINDLAESFKVVGSQSAIAGVSLEETAGALEILSKNNIKGSEAGTHLRNIILSLQTVFGADLKKMTLTEALDQLKPKMEDATFMSQNFGRMSMASAQFLIKNAEAIGEMTDKVTGTDTALEQANIRTETTQQMMARCRAKIDDLKIGFFELTGSAGGYMTIIAEQAVTVAQLLPLLTLLGKGIKALTSAEKLHAMWIGIVKGATTLWTGVQWLLNAALWASPITWIVAAIAALVAIIIVCVTKVQGWGAQWKSVTEFMKLSGQLFVKTIKYEFQSMVNGIMIGLDYIKIGWYKFKKAVGIGDKEENLRMIDEINTDINRRKSEITDGAKELRDLAKEAGGALTWELSWKKKPGQDPVATGEMFGPMMYDPAEDIVPDTSRIVPGLNLNGKRGSKGSKTGTGTGSKSSTKIDLNDIVPNLSGTASYTTIASRLAPIKMATIAAATSVLPVTAQATAMPQDNERQRSTLMAEYRPEEKKQTVSMTKFCDTVEIHIANAGDKDYQQIEKEIVRVVKQVFDDNYGA